MLLLLGIPPKLICFFSGTGRPMSSLLHMNVVETWFLAVWGLCWCNFSQLQVFLGSKPPPPAAAAGHPKDRGAGSAHWHHGLRAQHPAAGGDQPDPQRPRRGLGHGPGGQLSDAAQSRPLGHGWHGFWGKK